MDSYEKTKINTARYNKIKKILSDIYGYENFREKQYEIINKIINKQDICAILPTGHGKSLTFQIPAVYTNKVVIVISPLISLMEDQKISLEKLKISVCCYNSSVENKNKIYKKILKGKYNLVYITPESLVSKKEIITQLNDDDNLAAIAIDEAHCISSYGHDFRKAYIKLNFIKEENPNIPILAITATATDHVIEDICDILKLKVEDVIKTSFDRPNLYLEIKLKTTCSKLKASNITKNPIEYDILPVLRKYKDKSIIIYCLTIKDILKIKGILKNHKIKCTIYHSKMTSEDRKKSHHQFINGEKNIIIATIAFGMGINKMDVRVIIHYGCSKNIEGYYQEIGRAGRDGKKSYCFMFYAVKDFIIQRRFINDIADQDFKENQNKLLKIMEKYIFTKTCRRKILLEYFGETIEYTNCNFCDNCVGSTQIDNNIVDKPEQNVEKEATMLLNLIESIPKRTFGINRYIEILRGSKNKNITPELVDNKYYKKGKDKSAEWWKELIENLVNFGYLQKVCLPNSISMQVIKVTTKGLDLIHHLELGKMINTHAEKIPLIKMIN